MIGDGVPGSVVVHAGDEIRYADGQFLALVGAGSRRELPGRSLSGLVAPEFRDPLVAQFERVDSGDAPVLGTTVSLRGAPGGNVIAVTSRVRWEGSDRLQTSFLPASGGTPAVGSFRAPAMDEAPIGITISDPSRPDNPLVYANDGFAELTGYPREEVLGRNCRLLQGAGTREEPVAELRRAIDAAEPVTVELRNYRKDGTLFWNRVTVVPVELQTGDVGHYLGYQRDVTDAKLHEREKTLFERHAEVTDDAIVVTDREGTITYVNPAFERITGYAAAEAIGRTPRILRSDRHDGTFYAELWGTITGGEIWEGEFLNRTKGGEQYRARAKIVPITDDRDEITHFVGIERDVTDDALRNKTLSVLNRILRHNLRTAASIIDGYAELLEAELDSPEQRATVEVIREETAEIERIAERAGKIRSLSNRTSKPRQWEPAHVESLAREYRRTYPGAEISVTVDVDGRLRLPDVEMFELALGEAVENAVSHADSPTVELSVTRAEDGEGVRILVTDDGPGIPEIERQVIAEGTETPLAHGQGVGLWIMEWVMTGLRGSVEIRDVEPSGTEVVFRLPAVEPSDAE